MCCWGALFLCLTGTVVADEVAPVPPKVTVGRDWTWLFRANPRNRGVRPLSANLPLKPLDDLELTGPEPGHKYVLGQFAADGKWGTVNGPIQLVEGHNAALKIGTVENFELEGVIELGEVGGWFILLGWQGGRGYSLINIGFRESPSPWFITEYRAGVAIREAHQEVAQFEWRRDQLLYLTVHNQELNLRVGKIKVLEQQMLPKYETGDVIFGVYDTNYGPRPIRISSIRMRALD
jgi:hypothetical protein